MHCDVRLARFVFDNCVSVPACEKIKDNFFTVDKFPHDRSQFCVSELVMNTKRLMCNPASVKILSPVSVMPEGFFFLMHSKCRLGFKV